MHVRLMFPAEYLSSEDLEAAGKDVTLTISGVEQEQVRSEKGREPRWVVSFREMDERHRKDNTRPRKRLILNKTNAKQIARLHGPETNDWTGKKITLYGTTCQAFGDTVGCVRIRDQVPSGGAPAPMDDEPPPDVYDDEELV